MKKTEIPADRSSWASFTELDERNLAIEREILEKAEAGGASRDGISELEISTRLAWTRRPSMRREFLR